MTYTIDELKSINELIDMKIKMSSLVIKNNYFNYLYNLKPRIILIKEIIVLPDP